MVGEAILGNLQIGTAAGMVSCNSGNFARMLSTVWIIVKLPAVCGLSVK